MLFLKPKKEVNEGVKVLNLPANDMAMKLGNIRVMNMIVLGAYLAIAGCPTQATCMKCLADAFGERRAHLLPVNEKAMELGAAFAKEALGL